MSDKDKDTQKIRESVFDKLKNNNSILGKRTFEHRGIQVFEIIVQQLELDKRKVSWTRCPEMQSVIEDAVNPFFNKEYIVNPDITPPDEIALTIACRKVQEEFDRYWFSNGKLTCRNWEQYKKYGERVAKKLV